MHQPLVFATGNSYKFTETSKILAPVGRVVLQANVPLSEIQSDKVNEIVEQKVKDAFHAVGRPVFVDHTALHLDHLNGFPAGLTKVFIAYAGEQRICSLFGSAGRDGAVATTTIGFCDGKTITQFSGSLKGRISPSPEGSGSHWGSFGFNRIFIPDGENSTFSTLGIAAKNRFSMRKLALEAFLAFLKSS